MEPFSRMKMALISGMYFTFIFFVIYSDETVISHGMTTFLNTYYQLSLSSNVRQPDTFSYYVPLIQSGRCSEINKICIDGNYAPDCSINGHV